MQVNNTYIVTAFLEKGYFRVLWEEAMFFGEWIEMVVMLTKDSTKHSCVRIRRFSEASSQGT
jgi:hypothetical protein